jgi:tetratricopeptide (TPR) repeat protein
LIDPVNPEIYKNIGNAYADLNDFESAKQSYLKAIEIKSDYKQGYFNLGTLYYQVNNLEEALKCFLKSAEIDPNCNRTLNALANIKESSGDLVGAEDYYRKSLTLDPDFIPTRLNLIDFYIGAKKFDQAEKLITEFPTVSARFYQLLGKLKVAQGDNDSALEMLLKAETIEPSPPRN